MRRIVCKIALAMVMVISAVVVAEQGLDWWLRSDRFYRIDGCTVLILGHSQTESAVDDSRIAHASNMSQSAEPYLYTYYKLVKLNEANKTITTVLLAISDNMFARRANSEWLFEKNSMGYKYPKYSHIVSFREKLLFLVRNPLNFKDIYVSTLQKKLFMALSGNDNIYETYEWGGYRYSTRDCLQQDIFNYRENALPDRDWTTRAKKNVSREYLQKIVDYCKDRNIRLILLRTPHHPSQVRLFEADLHQLLQKNLAGVTFWDYADYPFSDDCFQDTLHLNHKGAEVFSDLLEQRLKQDETRRGTAGD